MSDIRGSSENKLKVIKPDEFDVDIVLTPKTDDRNVQVSLTSIIADYEVMVNNQWLYCRTLA